MRKILYIVDYPLHEYNSVRDILYNILHHEDMCSNEQILIMSQGALSNPLECETIDSYKHYSTPEKTAKEIMTCSKFSPSQKFIWLFRILIRKLARHPRLASIYAHCQSTNYLKKIMQIEEPDFIIFFSYFPQKKFFPIVY